MERAFRYDIVGTVTPACVEDCAHCGADLNLAGNCSAKCEQSRKAAEAKQAQEGGKCE